MIQEIGDLIKIIMQATTPGSTSLSNIRAYVIIFVLVVVGINTTISLLLKLLDRLMILRPSINDFMKGIGKTLSERQEQIRCRQFCNVLETDLATIAKRENWNDYYFTELEAEIELNGVRSFSMLDKILRRNRYGIQRATSLLNALKITTSRNVLLIGEPGSGKSISLRHLAKQLARNAQNQRRNNPLVPLYINLRELNRAKDECISSDLIKRFVLDNIRRNDSDTTAYVREHWDQYKSIGKWFFIFDSFDEIPEVLHAPSGSNIIEIYAEAIRKFLDGMGACRSILASREFKGPQHIPWPIFRILPLNEKQQIKLAENAVLDAAQLDSIKKYIYTATQQHTSNPLFLSLLCRHIKDGNVFTDHDHNIIIKHIHRLAHRDSDYLMRNYSLSPDDLIIGAEKIAVTMAQSSILGLAPRHDEIIHQFNAIQGNNITENLLEALIDLKIARSDSPSAKSGDKIFAFSHRRYQESLFVEYLASHPEVIRPYDMMTGQEWRDYAVTLLQTQTMEIILPFLNIAEKILWQAASQQKCKKPIMEFSRFSSISSMKYYDWDSDSIPMLLELLTEGMARRLGDVPENLSLSIGAFLMPRWEGDYYDRLQVLKLGGLLPGELLSSCLFYGYSFGFRNTSIAEMSFKQSIFLRNLTGKIRTSIAENLAENIICSISEADLLRVEVLAARLPKTLDTTTLIKRNRYIRTVTLVFSFFGRALSSVLSSSKIIKSHLVIKKKIKISEVVPSRAYIAIYPFINIFQIGFMLDMSMFSVPKEGVDPAGDFLYKVIPIPSTQFIGDMHVLRIVGLLMMLSAGHVIFVFLLRARLEKISLGFIFFNIAPYVGRVLADPRKYFSLFWFLMIGFPMMFEMYIFLVPNYFWSEQLVGIVAIFLVIMMVVLNFYLPAVKSKEKKNFLSSKEAGKNLREILAKAKNLYQLSVWIGQCEAELSNDRDLLRSLSCIIRYESENKINTDFYVTSLSNSIKYDMNAVQNIISKIDSFLLRNM